MSIQTRILMAVLAVTGVYYIITLFCDGAKLQRFRKKYYTIYSSYNDNTNKESVKERGNDEGNCKRCS